MTTHRILYVEDEPFLSHIVTETLQQQGFDVKHEPDGSGVIDSLNRFRPDVCVLDIMLPGVDGYTLCRQIKARQPNLPVIFLTAKTETPDLVKGFEAGGTDYMRKPFSIEELIIRIRNQIGLINRRFVGETVPDDVPLGRYRLIPSRYELVSPSRTIKLSQRDMEVISMLASNKNQITDRRELLISVWGDDTFFNSRTLDVYIRKIREYLSEDPAIELVTLKGKGYLFIVK
ncbi:MAG: response regulator transcription factor [Bacteroidales bacterium]|nr:response regulator transcription factor [Bacteroidales bacterium]MDD3666489.1 response regulator transcription factor [Bacteroidales bacterium]